MLLLCTLFCLPVYNLPLIYSFVDFADVDIDQSYV